MLTLPSLLLALAPLPASGLLQDEGVPAAQATQVRGVPLGSAVRPEGDPRDFLERFVLSADRAALVEELIPGTVEHYEHRVLVLQQARDWSAAADVLERWRDDLGAGGRWQAMDARQQLLAFESDPAATLAFLRERLQPRLDHAQELPGATLDLPTRLAPERLAPERLRAEALARSGDDLRAFEDHALPGLAASDLTKSQLGDLLERLEHAFVPNLPALIVRDLRAHGTLDLGSRSVHGRLTLEQLEELVRQEPRLLNASGTIERFLRRLRPSVDAGTEADPAVRAEQLERLARFVRRLAPEHNSLKAHVLYHKLDEDRRQGRLTRAGLLEYLRLPRQSGTVVQDVLRGTPRRQRARLDADYATDLAPVGDDTALVHACLLELLAEDESTAEFDGLVEARQLRRLFAEAKLLAGVGDRSRWYALLDSPEEFEQLEARVELEFAPTQRQVWGMDDAIQLELDVKNVERLLVKVFEIDTFTYYRTLGREVDTAIQLEGLVSNAERTLEFDAPPIQRVRRVLELPELDRPGVFVVELVGGGVASRAVLRKGTLRTTERLTAAGHAFRVFDEAGRPLEDATLWFGGVEYTPGDAGEILLPYSTDPEQRTLVVRHGERAALARFDHSGERYRLSAGVHVEREALLDGGRAQVLVRPNLTLNGRRVSLQLLESPVVILRSTDQHGISATRTLDDLELRDDGELVTEIAVPAGLVALEVELRGKVLPLTGDEPVQLEASKRSFRWNQILSSSSTDSPLLSRTAGGYVLDVLGRDGEPRPGRAVRLSFDLEDYREEVRVVLQTDAAGRIHLGPLTGVRRLSADGFAGEQGDWELQRGRRTYPLRVTGRSGEILRIPFVDADRSVRTAESDVLLYERRGGAVFRDARRHLSLVDGFFELKGLAPGDYALVLPNGAGAGVEVQIYVAITAGEARLGWAQGRNRWLALEGRRALHLEAPRSEGETLVLQLVNAGPEARVHVAASRYVPAFSLFDDLRPATPDASEDFRLEPLASEFEAGRALSDEVRYVLERRFLPRYAGNLLPRPGLLLNPWELEQTNTVLGLGGGAGGRFGGRRSMGAAGSAPGSAGSGGRGIGPAAAFPDLSFLAEAGVLLTDLRPDAEGVVRVPLSDLGDAQDVRVLALDGDDAVLRTWARTERPLSTRPRALAEALDPESAVAERRRVEVLDTGDRVQFEELPGARAELVDSMAAALRLLRTLSGDPQLDRFAFLVDWPTLSDEAKRSAYAEHACHELHLFLFERDRPFFDAVVRPYLANKLEREFLDDWVLEADLTGYLEPWAFARLNAAERALLARRTGSPALVEHLVRAEARRVVDAGRERAEFDRLLGAGDLDASRGYFFDPAAATATPDRDEGPPAEERLRGLGYGAGEGGGGESADELGEELKVLAGAPFDSEVFAGLEALGQDARERGRAQSLFRQVGATRLLVESNYWRVPIRAQLPELVPVDAFWRDLARHGSGPFVSPHLAQAAGTTTEMLLALAVLDLPFTAPEHELEREGRRATLRAAGPLMVVRRELGPVPFDGDAAPVLVSQGVYRLDEPRRTVGGREVDAFVTDEFVVGVAYGARVVVTNPTSDPRELEVLVQVPQGAIPVAGSYETRGQVLRLEPYGTATQEFAFYFPRPGETVHTPARVTEALQDETRLVARSETLRLPVVSEPTRIDTASWEHVSQAGSLDEVLAFLDQRDPATLELERIAWRLRDADAFGRVLGFLRERHVFAPVLWSYGLLHGDAQALRETLAFEPRLTSLVGPVFSSPLLTLDPIERRWFERMEFDPLVLARTHPFGGRREQPNARVATQYRELLSLLRLVPRLGAADWMELSVAFLLQGRIEEARGAFAQVDPGGLSARLQYDYLHCYLAFFGGLEEARELRDLAASYADHPVERWRARFGAVVAQIDEATGAAPGPDTGSDSREGRQDRLASQEPALDLAVEGQELVLRHANVTSCELRFYPLDVELLFSSHPFGDRALDAFGFVRPRLSRTVELTTAPPSPGALAVTRLALPADFARDNVAVEARTAGIVRRAASYATSLNVRLMESYGQLQVRDASGQPLSHVYVKVFARSEDGTERFHKDGTTDLRGRFDYATLSGDPGDAERFAILVLDDQRGAVVREVTPPQR